MLRRWRSRSPRCCLGHSNGGEQNRSRVGRVLTQFDQRFTALNVDRGILSRRRLGLL